MPTSPRRCSRRSTNTIGIRTGFTNAAGRAPSSVWTAGSLARRCLACADERRGARREFFSSPCRLADVLRPDFGMIPDVIAEQADARLRVQVHDANAVLTQPGDAAVEVYRLSDDHCADPELADEPAAIPTRRERAHQHAIPIVPAPSGLPKCVSFG